MPALDAQRRNGGGNVDWPLHNLDLAGSRYSTIDQINAAQREDADAALAVPARHHRRRQQSDDAGRSSTGRCTSPIRAAASTRSMPPTAICCGSFDVTEADRRRRARGLHLPQPRRLLRRRRRLHRRPDRSCFALDAKTGKPIPRLRQQRPGAASSSTCCKQRYPGSEDADQHGLLVHHARRRCHNGVIYIGSTRSESHIPGGHVLAVDAKTGKVLWHFNTIPQDEKDQGWEIAGPTWVGGERNGGGIWETPSIDPELGLLYVAVANPFGDSTKRAGMNLFTRLDHRAHARYRHAEVVLPADASRRLGLRLRQPADPVRHAGAAASASRRSPRPARTASSTS